MKIRFYVFASDLAACVIGPFDTYAEADEHIRFCDERGDAAEMAVHSVEDGEEPLWLTDTPRMTPEADRAFKVEEVINRLKAAGQIPS